MHRIPRSGEVYGTGPGLRSGLEHRQIGYVLAVACGHRASAGARQRADAPSTWRPADRHEPAGESPRSQDGIPCTLTGRHGTVGIMNIEVAVPSDWTPGQAMAVRQLLQHAVHNAQPVIALVRKDVTAEQLQNIYRRIEEVIREAGLEADPAPAPSP